MRNGRLVEDVPTQLPEETVVDLVLDDEGDELDEAQRAALDAALGRSLEQGRAGQSSPADAILEKLRARREG